MAKILRQFIFYSALLGLWALAARLEIWPPYLFPSPLEVFSSLLQGFQNKTYLVAVAISFKRLLIGYGIAAVCGIAAGLLVGRFRRLDETVGGFFTGLQTLPSVCWLPLAILWFGLSESAIVFVVVMGSLLSITIATVGGVKSIPPLVLRAGRNFGARGFRMFWHVILPASVPAVVAGLKQGWSFAWRSLMAGEILFVSLGLGHLLNMGRELNDMSRVLAVMLLIIAIGVLVDMVFFGAAEKRLRKIWGLEAA